ncbi:hypothetical protein YC2023_095289 [Brassica napus]
MNSALDAALSTFRLSIQCMISHRYSPRSPLLWITKHWWKLSIVQRLRASLMENSHPKVLKTMSRTPIGNAAFLLIVKVKRQKLCRHLHFLRNFSQIRKAIALLVVSDSKISQKKSEGILLITWIEEEVKDHKSMKQSETEALKVGRFTEDLTIPNI